MAINYDKPTDYDQDIAAQNSTDLEKGTDMYDTGVSATKPTIDKNQNYDFNRRDRMLYNINKTGIVVWDNNTSYIKGSLVFYKERTYISIANSNKNNDPETSSGDWVLIDDHIRITEPSANSLGTIKFLPVVAGSNTALQLATPQEVENLLRPLRYVPFEEWDSSKPYLRGQVVKKTTQTVSGLGATNLFYCVTDNTNTDPEDEFQTKILTDYTIQGDRASSNSAVWRPINRTIFDSFDGECGEGNISRFSTWRSTGQIDHSWNGMLQTNGTPVNPNPVDTSKLAKLRFRFKFDPNLNVLTPVQQTGAGGIYPVIKSGVEYQRTTASSVYDGMTAIWYAPPATTQNPNEDAIQCQLSGYSPRITGTPWVSGLMYANYIETGYN